MATPTLERLSLAGALGPIAIDVRSGHRTLPGPTIVVLHGFKGFKDWGMFPPLADRMARAGFNVVSLNVSGSGADDQGQFSFPERFGHNSFTIELADIALVLGAVDRGDLGLPRPTSIGLIGHSRGGGMATLVTAANPRIGALVTWAAISHVRRWTAEQRRVWRAAGKIEVVNTRTGQVLPMYLDTLDDIEHNADGSLDIEAAAARVGVPWLIVHGDADEAVPVAEAVRLAEVAKKGRVESLILPGAGHTFGAVEPFRGMTPALEQAFDATVAFLSRVLG